MQHQRKSGTAIMELEIIAEQICTLNVDWKCIMTYLSITTQFLVDGATFELARAEYEKMKH